MPHLVVREHTPTFLSSSTSAAPNAVALLFIGREFQRFVPCGVLTQGFARFRCAQRGTDPLVAFSCKGRSFCPSCGFDLFEYIDILYGR